ncbi:MAG: cytochrome c-type biogenesis CcmF C-terminal domain-containing protein, partial [Candidatus Kapaibacteriota bacterium]
VPETKDKIKINSRQFLTFTGIVILIIASIVVIVGTSLPVIQGFIGAKKVALEPTFYNQWMTPIATLILIVNAISLLLDWREMPTNTPRNKLIYSVVPSFVMALIFLFVSHNNVLYSFLIFSSLFSLIINGEKLLNKLRKRNFKIGALLSHLGISFLIVGAIFSGGFEKTQTIQLQEGKMARAFGYEIHLLNKERIEIEKPDREKYRFKIRILDEGKNSIIYPVVYWSSFNNFEQPYYEPDIKTYLTKDLYFAPKSFMFNEFYSPISFKKGEILPAPWSEKDSIKFNSYDMRSMHFGKSQENFTFGIIVDYYIDGNFFKDTILSLLNMKSGSFSPIWKNVPTKDFAIGFTKFTPEENLEKSTVELTFGQEILIADVIVKPFILLVWLGVIFTVAGFIIAVFKYSMKRTQKDEPK